MKIRSVEEYESDDEQEREPLTAEEREQVLRSILEASGGKEEKIQSIVWGTPFKEAIPFLKLLSPPWTSTDYPIIMNMFEERVQQTVSTVKAADAEHRKYQILRVMDASKFDTELKPEPALVLVERETQEVQFRSADTTYSFVPKERTVGHRNLFKDIMTTVRFSGGVLVPIAPIADFEAANPCPLFNYKGIESFAKGSSKALKASSTRNLSSREKARHLAQVLQEMSTPDFLKLMMTFYITVFRVKTDDKGLVLTDQMPLSYVFGHPSMKNAYPEIGSRRSYIYRSRGLKMKAIPPKNDKEALKKTTTFRNWRGEDENFYSLFTQHYNRGGDPSKDQVQVCQALSLILPALDNTILPLVVRPSSTSVARHLGQALAARDIKYSFHLSEQVATSLRVAMKTDVPYVEAVPFESLYVDLHSMEIPTVPTGTDVFAYWKKLHAQSVPKTKEWIARRKVYPDLVDELETFCYAVNSSHAYDVIESNIDGLMRRVGVVNQDYGVDEVDKELKKLDGETLRVNQFVSNRKKTCLLQSDDLFKVDEALNLWEPPIELQKRDLRMTKVLVESAVQGGHSTRQLADIPDELPAFHKKKKRKSEKEEVLVRRKKKPEPKEEKKKPKKAPPPPVKKLRRVKAPTPSPSESHESDSEEGEAGSESEQEEQVETELPEEAGN